MRPAAFPDALASWEPGAALENPEEEGFPQGVPGAVLLAGMALGCCTAAEGVVRSLEGARGVDVWNGAPAEPCCLNGGPLTCRPYCLVNCGAPWDAHPVLSTGSAALPLVRCLDCVW